MLNRAPLVSRHHEYVSRKRLEKSLRSTVYYRLFFSLLTILCFASTAAADELSIPEFIPIDLYYLLPTVQSQLPASQIIQMVEKSPDWKIAWDEARSLLRQHNYSEAVEKYLLLLSLKGNLAEARWELVVLLLEQGDLKQASTQLEILLDQDPDKDIYVLVQAVLIQKLGKFERSLELLGKVSTDSVAQESLRLSSLVNALHATGRKRESLAALQQLVRKKSTEIVHRLNLAVLAYHLESDDIAKKQVDELIADGHKPPSLLLMAARLHGRLRLTKQAVQYWQDLLKELPENMEAHSALAAYYEEFGMPGDALSHLLVLQEENSLDPTYLKRIGQAYLGMQNLPEALVYFKKFLAERPGDKVVARYIVKIHAAMGDKEETLNALEHFFAIEERPQKNDLQQAADLYDEGGYFKAAIPIYRRLLEMTPDDPELLGSLAQNLLATGQDEDALQVWQQLAEVVPQGLEVYRPMATLLEKLGRKLELVEVLAVINGLDPGDQQVIFKLAALHFESGRFDQCMLYIEKMIGPMRQKPEFFRWRGTINKSRGHLALALADFNQLVILEPGLHNIRLECVELAGLLGDLATLRMHADSIVDQRDKLLDSTHILLGRAFLTSGDFAESALHYQIVVDKFIGGFLSDSAPVDLAIHNENGFLAVVGLAESYLELGLPYEAEQVLRQGFVVSGDVRIVGLLFDLSIDQGWFDDARDWIKVYQNIVLQIDANLQLMWARYHLATGERKLARQGAGYIFSKLPKKSDHKPLLAGGKFLGRWRGGQIDQSVELVELLVSLGEYGRAMDTCRVFLHGESSLPTLKVLYHKIYQESKGTAGIRLAVQQLGALQPDILLVYGFLLREQQMFVDLEALFEQQGSQVLRARLFMAEAKAAMGNKSEALEHFEEVLVEMPDNQGALVALVKLMFVSGQVSEAADISLRLDQEKHKESVLLLRARLHWLQHDWDQAVESYEEILATSVEQLLEIEAAKLQLALPEVQDNRSFLEKILDVDQDPSAVTVKVMSPGFMQGSSSIERQKFNLQAAGLLALFRWQKKFAGELEIRRAVQRQEYVLAAKQYETFIWRNPEETHLLFDLAGVYSRLGRLGDEAALYEELVKQQVYHPDLEKNMVRNRLKQKPFVALDFGYNRESGRQGHKDIESNWAGATAWYSPATQSEVMVSATRYNHHSVDSDHVVRGNRLFSSFKVGLWQGGTAVIGAGVYSMDDGDTDNLLLSAEVAGRIGDKIQGSLAVDRDVVADTTESLTREIIRQGMDADISVDLLPRLEVGGRYMYDDYSDNNWTTGYDFHSSYILFSEPTFLKVNYKYDFRESREGRIGDETVPGSFTPENHPYWAPKNYWTNTFGVYFKHLLGKDTLGRDAPRYYTAEYNFGHDSDGYAVQTLQGELFVEFSPSWLLKASGALSSSQEYRQKQFIVSAAYRW